MHVPTYKSQCENRELASAIQLMMDIEQQNRISGREQMVWVCLDCEYEQTTQSEDCEKCGSTKIEERD